MIHFSFSFLLLLQLAGFALSQQLSSHLSTSDVNNIKNKARKTLESIPSLPEAYFASRVLQTLDDASSASTASYQCDCARINELTTTTTCNSCIFYGKSLENTCGCKAVDRQPISRDRDDIDYFIGLALSSSVAKPSEVPGLIQRIANVLSRDVPKLDSLRNGLFALTQLSNPGEKFTDVVHAAMNYLPQGNDESAVDATIFQFLTQLNGEKLRVEGNRLLVITESLVQGAFANDPAVVFRSLSSLNAIKTYKTQPLFVSLADDQLSSKKSLTFIAKDVFGDSKEIDTVEITAVAPVDANSGSSSFSGKFDSSTVQIPVDDLKYGVYKVSGVLTVKNRTKSVTAELYFSYNAKVSVSKVLTAISTSSSVKSSSFNAVASQNDLKTSASSINGDVFHVAFVLSSQSNSVQPHQTFIKFSLDGSNENAAIFAALPVNDDSLSDISNADSDVIFRLSVNLEAEAEYFKAQSGLYTVSILVGDSKLASSIEWILGSVELKFPKKPKVTLPLYTKSLLDESDNTLVPLPEISHKMRPPAKRANVVVSTFFTFVSLLPLGGLAVYLLKQKGLQLSISSIWKILFIVSVIATLALYAAYWLALPGASFYETVKYLCFLIPITAFFGVRSVHTHGASAEGKTAEN